MSNMGRALMGTGVAKGQNRARLAAEMAVTSPLLDDISVEGATGRAHQHRRRPGPQDEGDPGGREPRAGAGARGREHHLRREHRRDARRERQGHRHRHRLRRRARDRGRGRRRRASRSSPQTISVDAAALHSATPRAAQHAPAMEAAMARPPARRPRSRTRVRAPRPESRAPSSVAAPRLRARARRPARTSSRASTTTGTCRPSSASRAEGRTEHDSAPVFSPRASGFSPKRPRVRGIAALPRTEARRLKPEGSFAKHAQMRTTRVPRASASLTTVLRPSAVDAWSKASAAPIQASASSPPHGAHESRVDAERAGQLLQARALGAVADDDERVDVAGARDVPIARSTRFAGDEPSDADRRSRRSRELRRRRAIASRTSGISRGGALTRAMRSTARAGARFPASRGALAGGRQRRTSTPPRARRWRVRHGRDGLRGNAARSRTSPPCETTSSRPGARARLRLEERAIGHAQGTAQCATTRSTSRCASSRRAARNPRGRLERAEGSFAKARRGAGPSERAACPGRHDLHAMSLPLELARARPHEVPRLGRPRPPGQLVVTRAMRMRLRGLHGRCAPAPRVRSRPGSRRP